MQFNWTHNTFTNGKKVRVAAYDDDENPIEINGTIVSRFDSEPNPQTPAVWVYMIQPDEGGLDNGPTPFMAKEDEMAVL